MGERVLTITAAKIEAVRGTPEASPTRRIYGTTDLTKVQPLVLRQEDVGQFSQLVGPESAVLANIEAGGTHNEDVTYEDLPWWAYHALKGKAAVAAVLSDVAAYTRTFDPSETVDNLDTSTFFQQDESAPSPMRMGLGIVDEWEITGAVGQPWAMRCTLLGSDLLQLGAPTPFTDPGARAGRETVRMGNTKLYIGAAGSDPAAQVTGTFIDFRLLVRNNIRRKYFGDGTDTMSSTIGREHREIECDFTFEATAAAYAEKANWSGNTPRVVSVEALGTNIPTTVVPTKKKARLVMPGMWDGWALSARSSNRIFTMKLRGLYDIGFGKQFRLVSTNGLPDPLA